MFFEEKLRIPEWIVSLNSYLHTSFTCQILMCIVVGLFWGGTNPVIKKAQDQEKYDRPRRGYRLTNDLMYLLTNWMIILPIAVNQCGSALYFVVLKYVDVSLSVPVSNSVALLTTALVGCALGEDVPTRKTILGACLILTGTTMLCYDKYTSL